MAAALSSVRALVSARVAPVLAARVTTVAAALGQKQTVARGGAWLHTLQATPYKVTLIMPAEVKVEMDVPANVSIVEHAKEVGVSLPASCHAGTCPRCAGKVVSGTVNQKKQKFLNPDQIAEGFVLTCVAYPTSDVVIKTHKETDVA